MIPGNCPGSPEADLRIALRLVPVYIAKREKPTTKMELQVAMVKAKQYPCYKGKLQPDS